MITKLKAFALALLILITVALVIHTGLYLYWTMARPDYRVIIRVMESIK